MYNKLKIDNNIFKNILKLIDVLIEKYNNKHALCRVFGIARSDYYHYLKSKSKKSKNQIEDEELKNEIKEIFHASEQRYEKRKIRAILMREGDDY